MVGTVQFAISDHDQGAEETRIGGQPHWLETAQWPTSRSTGDQMWFIGQFRTSGPEGDSRMAYVFMTNAAGYADDAWEYDAGENAVIIQPGGVVPRFVSVSATSTGPTCGPVALPAPSNEPEHNYTRIGGPPIWLQADGPPADGPWRLVAQLDSMALPFTVNFGDGGWGYVFVNEGCSEGRFLWQCS